MPMKIYKLGKFEVIDLGFGLWATKFGQGQSRLFSAPAVLTKIKRLGQWIRHYAKFAQVWPVYFHEAGTDCGGFNFESYVRYSSYAQAIRSHAHTVRWADGVIHFYRISRREYLQATRHNPA